MPHYEAEKGEQDLDFKWGIKKGVGRKNKDFQFYESFTYEGKEYSLYDSVVLYRNGDPETFIGKLVRMCETPRQEKKVKILWFFRPSEVRNFLNDYKPKVNELFLASGEGVGLYNFNYVESIVGKCNVLCASHDPRNSQVSNKELCRADYIFSRTFDVAKCKIEESFPEEIAGVKVENFFNRKEDTALANNLNVKEDVRGYTGASSSTSRLGLDAAANSGIRLSPIVKESKRAAADVDKQGYHPSNNIASRPKSSVAKLKTGNSFSEKRDEAKVEHYQALAFPASSKPKIKVLMGKSNLSANLGFDEGSGVSSAMQDSRNAVVSVDKQWRFPNDNNTLKPEYFVSKYTVGESSAERKDRLKVERFFIRKKDEALLNNSNPHVGGRIGKSGSYWLGLDKAVGSAVNDDTSGVKNSPVGQQSEKAAVNLDKPGQYPSDYTTSKPKTSVDKGGIELDSCSQVKSRAKMRHVDDIEPPSALDVPFKKRKLLQHGKTSKEFDEFVQNKDSKIDSITPKERSFWFKQPVTWERKLQRADKSGMLVSLENLDPCYTSCEVEDLIRQALNEEVEAKMLQRSALYNPNYGKALVIFKSKDRAESAISELMSRCLMVADGRPVIGSRTTMVDSGKLPARLIGHLYIDKLRLKQSENMKKAVSTSHCSQPNNIEYDMAIQWLLQQATADEMWKALYKKQEKEIQDLRSQLQLSYSDDQ